MLHDQQFSQYRRIRPPTTFELIYTLDNGKRHIIASTIFSEAQPKIFVAHLFFALMLIADTDDNNFLKVGETRQIPGNIMSHSEAIIWIEQIEHWVFFIAGPIALWQAHG